MVLKKLLAIATAAIATIPSVLAVCTKNGVEVPCSEVAWIFITMGIVFLAVAIFWIWMLVDCIKREFDSKVLWILIILLTGLLGAIIYYFVVKRKG